MSLRPLIILALAGLFLLPDWSEAWQRRRRMITTVPCAPAFAYSAPTYHPPAVSASVYHPAPYHPPVVVSGPVGAYPTVASCPPVAGSPVVIHSPKVEQERSTPTPMPMKTAAGESPKSRVETPAPKPTAAADTTAPKLRPELAVPQPPVIRTISNEERLPMTPVPALPPANIEPALPRFPEIATPKPAPGPAEEPMKAPVKAESLPTFPVPGESKPLPTFPMLGELKAPEPKSAEPKGDALPQFDLPPLPPLAAPQPATAEKPTTVKSSPLNASTADVYPVVGAAPAKPDAPRRIDFTNKGARELRLTINGRAYTLRPDHVLTLELPAEFKWQIRDEAEQTATVPPSAPGLDVVIRK